MNKKRLASQEMIQNWEEKQDLEAEKRPKFVLNRIKTPDGTIISSYYTHDYVTHEDKNGKVYMVDGGLEYLRRNVHDDAPYEELSVTTDAPFEQIRESLHWGSRGKDGRQGLRFFPLCRMADDHLEAILETTMGAKFIREYMQKELDFRKSNNIHVKETE